MFRSRLILSLALVPAGGACDSNVNIDLLPIGAFDDTDAVSDAASDEESRDQTNGTATALPLSDDRASGSEGFTSEPSPSTVDAAITSSGHGVSAPERDAAPHENVLEPIHHYDFAGEGDVVRDIVAGANGVVIGGAVLDGTGGLELDGLDDFVDLPNALLSPLTEATLTLWLEWGGGPCWQRLFDFGSSSAEEGTPAGARTSLFVTPASCPSSHLGPVEDDVVSLMFHVPGNYSLAQDTSPLPASVPAFVALSVGAAGALQLSLDGRTAIELSSALRLSDLDDVNSWLGRSQWGQDPTLRAHLLDFRIYDVALSSEQLSQVFEEITAGP
jgi:Concanavalin A-like lectin/glucanases superfamily